MIMIYSTLALISRWFIEENLRKIYDLCLKSNLINLLIFFLFNKNQISK
jgi:hypothetical protein